jgi:DNA uptake protein ComE-like DNA-binding protein
MTRQPRHILRSPRSQGTILVVALFVLTAITSLSLVHARTMRVEGVVAANRQAAAQARCVAMGAAQAILAMQLDAPTQAVEVTGGAYWLIRNNGDDDHTYYYGLVDEASKININSATADMLEMLPNMTAEIADAIIDWRDEDSTVQTAGAESEYYTALDDPYEAKNQPFETIEELSLVRDVTALHLYGEDYNQNGVLDANEDDGADTFPPDNKDGKLDRGFIQLATVYSFEPTTNKANVNGNTGSGRSGSSGSTGKGGSEGDAKLREVLQSTIGGGRAEEIYNNIVQGRSGRGGRPYRNIIELFYRSQMTVEEFNLVEPQITTSSSEKQVGLININTAPKEVLMTLPGIDEADADAIIASRGSSTSVTTNNIGINLGPSTSLGGLGSTSMATTSTTNTADPTNGAGQGLGFITQVLTQEKAMAIGGLITVRSYQYSADIVAVSSDGRAFERYRMVYDISSGKPKVLAWKRLTHLGWPLDPQILADLRSGKQISELITPTTVTGSRSKL